MIENIPPVGLFLGPVGNEVLRASKTAFAKSSSCSVSITTLASLGLAYGVSGFQRWRCLDVGGLVVVGWGFQEPLMSSRASRASPTLISRGLLALSIMFLIVLLHPQMLSASKFEYDLR